MRGFSVIVALSCVVFQIVNATVCKPGSTFQAEDGCNLCICSPDGENAACTSKACIQTRDIPADDGKCTIGDSYREECNTCYCETGIKSESICTLMACN